MPRRSHPGLASLAFLAALTPALPALAQEGEGEPPRRRRPQNNEIEVQADIVFQAGPNKYAPDNVSDITVGYVWLPGGGLDKNDVVVPVLRKFVRQPLELGVRYNRHSDQFDAVNGLQLHGTYWPIRFVYVNPALGLEMNKVENDIGNTEGSYYATVVRAEAGVRVLELLQLGAFYHGRSLFDTDNSDVLAVAAQRTGGENWYGLSLGFATPNDRLLLTTRAGFRDTDWSFEGFHRGTVSVEGVFAEARIAYQSGPTMSWFLRTNVSQEDWNDQRDQGEIGGMVIPRNGQKDVVGIDTDLGFVFWFEGKWGFRVSFGGGYTNGVPVEEGRETGRIRFGVGFTNRY
jgi:hypothetical protein